MSGGGLKFWKPGTSGPGSSLDRETETEGNVIQSAPAYASLSIQAQREHLPIYKHSECGERTVMGREVLTRLRYVGDKLLYCVEKHGVIIVVGQTGCGKTTRECGDAIGDRGLEC